ncbi:DUF6512 family protein [Lacrimispora xylanolytica]|uniref:DUF6512 family protein n=1 Tax=Lacrimispora xylanolytica TaxID=29375 RepID=A0ABY7AJQ5_9FIRM|nr:DUF6512 family protein [Lacrimispora xylanolytica]WAJ26028.1 DUF6512 family protein [Lacrimispora xylanolytica]
MGTLFHFAYEWSGENPVVGLISPVNESVWEHMKLIFFPMVIFGLLKKDKETNTCQTSAYYAGMLTGTFLIPVVFYIYTAILGKSSLIFDILLFYVSVFIAFAISLYFSKNCLLQKYNKWLFAAVLLLMALFFVFTYAPPSLPIFMTS